MRPFGETEYGRKDERDSNGRGGKGMEREGVGLICRERNVA